MVHQGGFTDIRTPHDGNQRLRHIRSLPFGRNFQKSHSACGGASFTKGSNLYACRRGWFVVTFGGASFIKNLISTARRRGVPFTRVKGTKTRLGLCPKTPVAGCAGYGLICGGSRKSIRTAHRIAPKVATGVSALSPHPLSRGGKGTRMGGRNQGNSLTLGVLGLAKAASRRPMVMVSGAGGLQEKGGRSPPPKRGRPGGGRCICDTL